MTRGFPTAANGRAVDVSGRALVRSAIPDGLVDNFEDADSDPPGVYESGDDLSSFYIGDLSQFSRQQTTVKEGSYALQAQSSSGNPYAIFSDSGSGLNYYPSQGDTWRYWFRASVNDDIYGFYFGTSGNARTGSGEGYGIRCAFNQPDIRISRLDSGSITNLNITSQSFSADAWYEMEIAWGTDDSIAWTLYDDTGAQLNSSSTTDSNYTSGGIGWSINETAGDSSPSGFFDYARTV
jgi:hypothetical protein